VIRIEIDHNNDRIIIRPELKRVPLEFKVKGSTNEHKEFITGLINILSRDGLLDGHISIVEIDEDNKRTTEEW